MNFMIEPIIMFRAGKDWKNWTHPNIQEIVDELKDEDQMNEACQVWSGPWVRIYVRYREHELYTVCTFLSRKDYEDHLKYCYKKFNEENYDEEKNQEIISTVMSYFRIALGEDVWAPGGKQFLYTDFGSKLNEDFDFFSDELQVTMFTPDVGIHDEGNHWSYSS